MLCDGGGFEAPERKNFGLVGLEGEYAGFAAPDAVGHALGFGEGLGGHDGEVGEFAESHWYGGGCRMLEQRFRCAHCKREELSCATRVKAFRVGDDVGHWRVDAIPRDHV